ncbi:MAG: ANTAR domain-containing protein [Frankiaceae bacterium]|nr:ANTAR domain-containing protein [Frankiaceae bacterium]
MHRDESAHDAELRAFAAASGRPGDVVVELARLLELALLAIPTCIGVSLVIRGLAPPVTLSALRPRWHIKPVLASLSVRLPRPPTAPASEGGAELRIYAGAAHAFADTAPSLLALLDMTARQVTVDAHLEAPDLAEERAAIAGWLDDQTVIDRAIGMLLDRGLLPDEARLELARLADLDGTSTLEVARALIASPPNGLDSA